MTITQSDLKMLVEYGAAKELTKSGQLPKGSRRILLTKGTYGMNGGLWVSKSGKLYACTSRGMIFYYA